MYVYLYIMFIIYVLNCELCINVFSFRYLSCAHESYMLLQEVNFDSARGGVSVITEKGDVTTSYLYIQRAGHSDTGEYKCSPSSANNVTVKVHILKGKFIQQFYNVVNK